MTEELTLGNGNDWERLAREVYRAGYAGKHELTVKVSDTAFFARHHGEVRELAEHLLNEPGASEMSYHVSLEFESYDPYETAPNIGRKTRKRIERSDEILCLSGGMDSLAAYHLMDNPLCIFVDYGQDHVEREREMANHVTDGDVIELSLETPAEVANDFGNPAQAWDARGFKIPGRNFAFLSALTSFGEYTNQPVNLGLGAYEGEIKPKNRDKSNEFFGTLTGLFSLYYDAPVRAYSPVSDMTKPVIADILSQVGTNLWRIPFCDSGTRCASCKSCFNFSLALDQSAFTVSQDEYEEVSSKDFLVQYPTYDDWVEAIMEGPMGEYYRENIEKYDGKRREEIRNFLSGWSKE